jgi:pimeloyl-ACP methyl ester carboxylesterase
VVLYGQSMGSAAILRALALHSHLRIEAAIVECPFDSLLNTVGNRFRAMGLPAFPGAQLLIFWASVQQGFNGFGHNPAEYAEQVECPVLLLHGADDPRVTLEQAEAIYNGLPRGKQMKVFADAGHELYLARQPEEWKRVVGEFLIHNVPQAQSRGKQ